MRWESLSYQHWYIKLYLLLSSGREALWAQNGMHFICTVKLSRGG